MEKEKDEIEKVQEIAGGDSSDDERVKKTSSALFQFFNPENKDKLKQREILQYMKTMQDDKSKGEHWRHVTEKLKDYRAEKIMIKAVRAKGGKSLRESDLVRLNKRFMAGHLPRLGRGQDESQMKEEEDEDTTDDDDDDTEDDDDEIKELKKELEKKDGYMYKGISYSLKSLLMLKTYMVKAVSKAGTTWLMSLVPTTQISTMFTFLLFSYVITASFLSWFVPLTILVFSMGLMVVSTMRMIRGVKRYNEFLGWAGFLNEVCWDIPKTVSLSKAEENYLVNHLSMYSHFFISTVLCVMSYGVSNKFWILNAELGILSLIMYGSILYVYGAHKEPTSVAMYGCQILATLLEGFHRADGAQVYGHIFSLPLPWISIVVHVSLPVIARLCVFVSVMSLLDGGRSNLSVKVLFLRGVLPHTVAIFWWEVAAMFLGNSSFYSVTRAVFEFLTFLFAMPLFLALFGLAVLRMVLSMHLLKFAISLALVAFVFVYFKVWRNKRELLGTLGKLFGAKTTQAVIILFGSLALGWAMVSYRPSGTFVANSNLTWAEYRDLCVIPKKVSQGNPTLVHMGCQEFKGYDVHWTGMVKQVEIVEVDNKVESLVKVLPGTVASWLLCVYGGPYPDPGQCDKGSKAIFKSRDNILCSVAAHAKRECHLHDYNVYVFRITIAMPQQKAEKNPLIDPILLSLDVTHDFHELVFSLARGAKLGFKGVITSDQPSVSARVLFTTSEEEEVKGYVKRHKRIETSLGRMIDDSINTLKTFLFYPAVTFADSEVDD